MPLLVLALACVSQRTVFEQILPSEDVLRVFCDIERGSFTYSGSSPDSFRLQVATWSTAVSEHAAQARVDTNSWGATIADESLDLFARSPASRTGVDLILEGPPKMDLEVVLLDGTAELFDVAGTQVITANGIVGTGVAGDLDLLATSDGMNLEAVPKAGQTLTLESYGDLALALPYGGEYDLEAFADPDWGVEVTDLGFDDLRTAPDYVRASTGSGAVAVDAVVSNGTFYLWNLEP